MFLLRTGFAIAILTLVASCSANNAANSTPKETQTTQENNQVVAENRQSNNSQTASSSQTQPVAVENTTTNNSQTIASSKTQPVAVESTKSNNSQTIASSKTQPVAVENTTTNNSQTISSAKTQPVAVENTTTNNSQTIASAKPKSESLEDTLIIPGKRFGSVNSKTTRTDLAQIFGESNLKDDIILQAEGTVSVPATKVNEGTKRSFVVFWKDETRQKISYLKSFGSEWKTPEGIGSGTSLKELRQKLGEFKLFGLAWDYGGFVNLEGTKLSQYKGKLSLTVDADENTFGKFPKEFAAVSGDREFSSTNPNFEPLNIRVNQVTVNFDE